MAEMTDIPTNVLAAGTLVFGAATGALGYLWKGKQSEVDRLQARYDALQEKYLGLLTSMVENEPARKDALLKIAQAQSETNVILKERCRTP